MGVAAEKMPRRSVVMMPLPHLSWRKHEKIASMLVGSESDGVLEAVDLRLLGHAPPLAERRTAQRVAVAAAAVGPNRGAAHDAQRLLGEVEVVHVHGVAQQRGQRPAAVVVAGVDARVFLAGVQVAIAIAVTITVPVPVTACVQPRVGVDRVHPAIELRFRVVRINSRRSAGRRGRARRAQARKRDGTKTCSRLLGRLRGKRRGIGTGAPPL